MAQPQEQPQDDDSIVHALNIHGTFFERWCQTTIDQSPNWRVVSVNHPVEFPPPNGPFRGKESALDLLAEHTADDTIVSLLVECKKNNPDFTRWIFFPKSSAKPLGLGIIRTTPREGSPRWSTETSMTAVQWSIANTDEGREVRGTYQAHGGKDKTKTSNAAISEACHQVALAMQAVFLEETRFSDALARHPSAPLPFRIKAFVPVVVTSAELYLCRFDPEDVNPKTGEIPHKGATLEPVQVLVYEYPLPRHLQNAPGDLASTLLDGSLNLFTRMPIVVVQSALFPDFLKFLEKFPPMFQSLFAPTPSVGDPQQSLEA